MRHLYQGTLTHNNRSSDEFLGLPKSSMMHKDFQNLLKKHQSSNDEDIDVEDESEDDELVMALADKELQTRYRRRTVTDFVNVYKTREGIGLYEPSLPRFPEVESFLERDVPDPRTKYLPISDIGKDFDEAMVGATMVNSQLKFVHTDKILFRSDYQSLSNRVKVVSGGRGIWSEFVGQNMLTCVVMGSKGAPKPRVIFVALRHLSKEDKSGIVAVVPNDQEDLLNWGIAVAKAQERGMNVRMVPVGVPTPGYITAEVFDRRGLSQLSIYFKIAGAMSKDNYSLDDIYRKLWSIQQSIASTSCHINDRFNIFSSSDNYETVNSKEEAITQMLRFMLNPKESHSIAYNPESKVVLLVNAYSGTLNFVQCIAAEAVTQMKINKILIENVYAGFYVSSVTFGFSLVLITDIDSDLKRWLGYSTDCPGWDNPGTGDISEVKPLSFEAAIYATPISYTTANQMSYLFEAILTNVKDYKNLLNNIDPAKKYGTKFCTIARNILKDLKLTALPMENFAVLFYNVADYFVKGFDDNDGIMYGIFFYAASQIFQSVKEDVHDLYVWHTALTSGVFYIQAYFWVDYTDGTIIDILGPLSTLLASARVDKALIWEIEETLQVCLEQNQLKKHYYYRVTDCPQATVYGMYALIEGLLAFIKNAYCMPPNEKRSVPEKKKKFILKRIEKGRLMNYFKLSCFSSGQDISIKHSVIKRIISENT